MSRRFFTADFHLGFTALLKLEHRPFSSVNEMNVFLLNECNKKANRDDTIIHLGDLASFGNDNHTGNSSSGLSVNPAELINMVNATFINIRGNHDLRNKVRSVADSLQLHLGKRYPNVTAGHYPSYDPRARNYIKNGWINLCGHVHSKWRYCLDLNRSILNINVGVPVWNYTIISEDELVRYINMLIRHKPAELYRCKYISGDLKFYKEGEKI